MALIDESKLRRSEILYLELQFSDGECFSQTFQKMIHDTVAGAHFFKLAPKMQALIDRVRVSLGRGHILTHGVEVDILVLVNDPATELDGGHMPLACCSEAHDESQ